MAYRLKLNEGLDDEVRRIADQQVGRMLKVIDGRSPSRKVTIHQVRKRCKKIRALLRLFRSALGDQYSAENAWYRDAAGALSSARDAAAMLEAYDELVEACRDHVDLRVLRPIRRRLVDRQDELLAAAPPVDELLAAFRNTVVEGRKRMDGWSLDGAGFEAISGGLGKTYKRAGKAMDEVARNPSPEQFHNWRKRCKYHWYHMRLLRDLWRPVMRTRRAATDRLAGLLGDHHNLVLLQQLLDDEPARFGKKETRRKFVNLVRKRREQIERQTPLLGARLFAEKPKRFVDRIAAYWEAAVVE